MVRWLYGRFPFDLTGDCRVPEAVGEISVSCVINFYGRMDLLAGILHSLARQRFPRNRLEVLLVEDRGGTAEGKRCAEEFAQLLPIRYLPLDRNFGKMGYSRNFGLAHSRGDYLLFLDDDTVILQEDFLEALLATGEAHPGADAFVPHGAASFALIEGRYDHHDPYFMTSRCMVYRRWTLAELGGFMDDFVGQEDVEFISRFHMAGKRPLNCPSLEYYHPPLLVPNFRKPRAVGVSFYRLRRRYPLLLWLLMIVNCARQAPLYLLPGRRNREMGRFGLGFIRGIYDGFRGRLSQGYT
jgi:glycosyltransferase involved in cell wall biosynthesis